MKHVIRQIACVAAALAVAAPAAAGVNVTYQAPEQFADLGHYEWQRQEVLRELSDHFKKLAAQLPPGQTLNVEVLDIDLAGRQRPVRWSIYDIRVINGGADWPHMKLRYSITQDGQVLKSGEEVVQNMMYTNRLNRYFTGDTLRYEKQMLDDWFKEKLAVR
ncbi:DUF3016 domain-containing protein [Massilia sp. PAMC28688]|uniref:DUF3016 domain-containing protein n=1 Tax=Massilia sp. PAMC28688 TaxID=2861283 RepID=UPI001C627232|nr:DUF3016 domain-containing protein [Massilia sp. PAMC28688]QYF94683.1 DUF3016 domain-containing protein [Massilia sp. PAMC28688]